MNKPIIISGDEFEVTMENIEGFVFLHLSITSFNHTVVKKLRVLLDVILSEVSEKGHNIVFATTTNKKILKLWNMIRPCFETQEVAKDAWMGSWLTFEGGKT
jgi:hypothetical protein